MGNAMTSPSGVGSWWVHHGGGGRRLRRVGVALFFGSVVVNAVLGIVALVAGETNERILGTSLAVTGALLLAVACLPAWERSRLGVLPPIGAVLSVVAFGLVIAGLWSGDESDTFGKVIGTAMAPAVGSAVACILAYPTLARRYRPVFVATLVLIPIAVAMIVFAIWAELESSWYPRAFGVVGVLLAATAVSIPVLARLSRTETDEAVADPIAFCPYCGAPVEAAATVSCAGCGRSFTVTGRSRTRNA